VSNGEETVDDGADDAELMTRAGKGDRDAFACLVRRHQQPLLNFFARMGAYTDAEDLAQETLVRVFRYRDRYRPTAKFTTFLYTVARHVRLDALRASRRRDARQEAARAEAEEATDGGMGAVQARMDVQPALDRLPEKLRSVIVLSVQQGLKHEEIAEVLGIPVGTVKSRMFHAFERLRKDLDETP
jgi:RNA polymerase sigma-70 factor (ECF subfamily)